MSDATPAPNARKKKRGTPMFFFLRGLAISLPPILTLLIVIWLTGLVNQYVIVPINAVVRYSIASFKNDIRDASMLITPPQNYPALPEWHRNYRITPAALRDLENKNTITAEELHSDKWNRDVYVPIGTEAIGEQFVPLADYDYVFKQLKPQPLPTTAMGMYMELVSTRYFKTSWHLSALALVLTVFGLYFVGRVVTVRIGAWMVYKFETLVMGRVPLVRNVYSTVKQVTDFVLSDREVEFNRVVAIEYPRKGIWSVGFVTGEGMIDCAVDAGEQVLSVLILTSPVPMAGYIMMVPRSEVLDLNLTVDQALQYIVSCGVLTPPHQKVTAELLENALSKGMKQPALAASGGNAEGKTNGGPSL